MASERLRVILNHLNGSVHPFTKRTSASRYVYTLDNNMLNDQQRAFYEENGFVVIPKLIEDEVLEECRHGSGPNVTKGFRKAITCHYLSNNCHFVDTEGTMYDKAAEDAKFVSNKRGYDLTLKEYFLLRQRLLKGKPGSVNFN